MLYDQDVQEKDVDLGDMQNNASPLTATTSGSIGPLGIGYGTPREGKVNVKQGGVGVGQT